MSKTVKFILIFAVYFVSHLAFVSPAVAAPAMAPVCHRLFAQNTIEKTPLVFQQLWTSFDQYQSFSYREFSNVLFLSDAGKSKNVSFGSRSQGPGQFLSTDFNVRPGVDVQVDNNHLNDSFREDQFDLIVMNRGLCPCHSATSCGGIANHQNSMKNFLRQVVGLLDKTNPSHPSVALLTGYSWSKFLAADGKTLPETWIDAAAQVSAEFPKVQIRGMQDREGRFLGVAIVTSPWVDIGQALRTLHPSLTARPSLN